MLTREDVLTQVRCGTDLPVCARRSRRQLGDLPHAAHVERCFGLLGDRPNVLAKQTFDVFCSRRVEAWSLPGSLVGDTFELWFAAEVEQQSDLEV